MLIHRSDGKELKKIPAVFRIIPVLMKYRNDAEVYFKQDIEIEEMDKYLARKLEEGINLSHMDILFTAIIRILAQRPHLNRFVMHGKIYARNDIEISISIKKKMSDEGTESTLKLKFDGTETLFQVHDILQKAISDNKDEDEINSGADKLTQVLEHVPTWALRYGIAIVRFLDNHSMLPKSIIKISPFHTSAFVTNVGSIGIDSIYHHIYNIGTTSMFFAMGKKKKSYIYEDDENTGEPGIKEEKCINIAFVGDERICDGYYYATSFKKLCRYLKHPETLEKSVERQYDDEI